MRLLCPRAGGRFTPKDHGVEDQGRTVKGLCHTEFALIGVNRQGVEGVTEVEYQRFCVRVWSQVVEKESCVGDHVLAARLNDPLAGLNTAIDP